MTNTLKASVAALAAVFAMAGVAQAEGITINLVGKDAKTIHDEIVQASITVCRDTPIDAVVISQEQECVADTIAKAEAQAHLVSPSTLAKADFSH